MFYDWSLNGTHEIDFVLVDSDGQEVTGLGSGFTLELREANGSFVAGVGTKAEIGNGWYRYTNVPAEADTVGPVAIRAFGTGTIQQNLLAVVKSLRITAVPFTYTVTDGATNPVEGFQIWITTAAGGDNAIWYGVTDALGVARDVNGDLPFLDPGSYYFQGQKAGYDPIVDDLEVVD